MATNEKEINNYLFDQLTIIERIRKALAKGDVEAELDSIQKEIERKLYQQPPLTSE